MIAKTLKNNYETDFTAGEVLLIDKEKGRSSFFAVSRVRKIANVKKVGHAGTLDPAATGLLILCTGKKTKVINQYQGMDKTYTGIISLGKKTPSMDSETEPDEIKDFTSVTEKMMLEVRDSFLGDIEQIPPMYSALKVKGQRLYKLARKGEEVVRQPRSVHINNFEIVDVKLPDVYFSITCSKGTYIRVIANDFGAQLGCGGYLKSLRRTQIGEYSVDNAFTLNEFEEFVNSSSN